MNKLRLILMIFAMTFSGSMGAYFLKRGTGRMEKITLFEMLKTPELYLGGVLYAMAAGLNIALLRILPYTVVYPMTSLTYVWTIIISAILLKERISINKILAVGFIIAGICCIAN